jgi:hypothetical protein
LLLRRRELRRTPQRVEKLLDSTLEPTSRTQRPFSVVFWPWFSGVVFVFDLPTGQIATFFNRLPLTAKFGEFLPTFIWVVQAHILDDAHEGPRMASEFLAVGDGCGRIAPRSLM